MLAEFFAMNGYGFYIWGAYGFAAIALTWLCLLTWCQARKDKDRR